MTSRSETPAAGHNSAAALASFIDRIVAVDVEIAEQRNARKEIFAEAKSAGFDTPTIRRLLALLAKDKDQLAEQNELLRVYGNAVGFDPFS